MLGAVYVLGQGDQQADLGLRYSLRSLEQWVNPLGEVTVVGCLPPFLQGVRHIPATDATKSPQANVNSKLLLAFRTGFSEDTVFLMNDDFWLLAPWDANSVYHKGPIRSAIKAREHNRENYYYHALVATERALNARGVLDVLNFELHCPFPVIPSLALQVLEEYANGLECNLLFRTLYGNHLPPCQIAGEISDRKCYRYWAYPAPGQTFISADDIAVCGQKARRWFEKTYPNPSERFEIALSH